MNQQIECIVMFADVAGSTRMYEQLGDRLAKDSISTCLNQMEQVVKQHDGELIKTIGDEIMCRFDDIALAIQAACKIQLQMEKKTIVQGVPIAVRIGLHYGNMVVGHNGELSGDDVRIAERVARIARAKQIMTTDRTIKHIADSITWPFRPVELLNFKNGQPAVEVMEILWMPQDATTLIGVPQEDSLRAEYLHLEYYGIGQNVTPDDADLMMGRDKNCDIIINTRSASRQHARIGYQRGKFFIRDHSTNGTLVVLEDGKNVYLHREELSLWGQGVISLGEPVNDDNENLIHFTCHTP